MGDRLDERQGLDPLSTTTIPEAPRRRSPIDWVGDRLRGRRRLQLALLLAAPLGWLVVAYLGSLAVMVFNALWRFDRGAQVVVKDLGLSNFRELWEDGPLGIRHTYWTITFRTIGVAAAVTVTCADAGLSDRLHHGQAGHPRTRRLLVIAVLIPLWASYVAKVYAWRTILARPTGSSTGHCPATSWPTTSR